MKIKSIKFQNNQFWGNAVFDFSDSHGGVYNTVVLAGENGCGKTHLLDAIYEFSSLSLSGDVTSEIRAFDVLLSTQELEYVLENLPEDQSLITPTGEFEIIQDFTIQSNYWGRIKVEYYSTDESMSVSKKTMDSSTLFRSVSIKRLFRTLYSTVEINYSPNTTSTITSKEIDELINDSKRSGDNLATEIQQLFIDIQANDANDLQVWVDQNEGKVPPTKIKNKRIIRFKKAFSKVFGDMNFSKIITEDNKKKVLFIKHGRNVDISALSSGEKQIVFRGAFLLKDQQSSKGCIVLIDEPEISLHPIWQRKIFHYYRELFTEVDGIQTSQMFFATHSQYVLQSALENRNDVLILLLKENGASIETQKIITPLYLPTLTSAELNYIAFGIASNDYHIELYGFLQSKAEKTTVRGCDSYIISSPKYHPNQHEKPSTYFSATYKSLPTYIRNAIDHPDSGNQFTYAELQKSIALLIELCK